MVKNDGARTLWQMDTTQCGDRQLVDGGPVDLYRLTPIVMAGGMGDRGDIKVEAIQQFGISLGPWRILLRAHAWPGWNDYQNQ